MKKEKKDTKDTGFVITDLENEEHNDAKPIMETEGPHGDKLSIDGFPLGKKKKKEFKGLI